MKAADDLAELRDFLIETLNEAESNEFWLALVLQFRRAEGKAGRLAELNGIGGGVGNGSLRLLSPAAKVQRHVAFRRWGGLCALLPAASPQTAVRPGPHGSLPRWTRANKVLRASLTTLPFANATGGRANSLRWAPGQQFYRMEM
jgi:hypothetical protein